MEAEQENSSALRPERDFEQGRPGHQGTRTPGRMLAMRYAVADVAMALDSVSQICDTGA